MSFSDITKAIWKIDYNQGYMDGFILSREREWFLETVTLEQMRKRKFQKMYGYLFNMEVLPFHKVKTFKVIQRIKRIIGL